MKNHLKLLCGAVMMVSVGQVSAATEWILGSYYGAINPNVTVTALANTNGSSVDPNANGQWIETADWKDTYGGVKNADQPYSGRSDIDASEGLTPEHAIDNNERYEMVLLTFTEKVNLSAVKLGWTGTDNYNATSAIPYPDSDITVMAFQGIAGFQGLIDKTWSTLDSGWKLIGHYSDVHTGTKSLGAAATDVYSSFWLIGAYNPLVGGDKGWSLGNDYVKLASVTGTVCPPGNSQCSPPSTNVPEPNSLALLGLGLLGVMRLRKARQA